MLWWLNNLEDSIYYGADQIESVHAELERVIVLCLSQDNKIKIQR